MQIHQSGYIKSYRLAKRINEALCQNKTKACHAVAVVISFSVCFCGFGESGNTCLFIELYGSYLFFVVGIKPGASHRLSLCCTTELHPSSALSTLEIVSEIQLRRGN